MSSSNFDFNSDFADVDGEDYVKSLAGLLEALKQEREKNNRISLADQVQLQPDHGPKHVQRVLQNLHFIILSHPLEHKALSEQERFVLFAAAILHDISLTLPLKLEPEVLNVARSFYSIDFKHITAPGDLNLNKSEQYELRTHHHKVSAAWIVCLTDQSRRLNERYEFSRPLQQEKVRPLIHAISHVIAYHDQMSVPSDNPVDRNIRTKLLFKLLHAADNLDSSRGRIDTESVSRLKMLPIEEKVGWWYRVCTSIHKDDGQIRLSVRCHPSNAVAMDRLCSNIHRYFKDKLEPLLNFLFKAGFKLKLDPDPPEVTADTAQYIIPEDIVDYLLAKDGYNLECQLVRLWASAHFLFEDREQPISPEGSMICTYELTPGAYQCIAVIERPTSEKIAEVLQSLRGEEYTLIRLVYPCRDAPAHDRNILNGKEIISYFLNQCSCSYSTSEGLKYDPFLHYLNTISPIISNLSDKSCRELFSLSAVQAKLTEFSSCLTYHDYIIHARILSSVIKTPLGTYTKGSRNQIVRSLVDKSVSVIMELSSSPIELLVSGGLELYVMFDMMVFLSLSNLLKPDDPSEIREHLVSCAMSIFKSADNPLVKAEALRLWRILYDPYIFRSHKAQLDVLISTPEQIDSTNSFTLDCTFEALLLYLKSHVITEPSITSVSVRIEQISKECILSGYCLYSLISQGGPRLWHKLRPLLVCNDGADNSPPYTDFSVCRRAISCIGSFGNSRDDIEQLYKHGFFSINGSMASLHNGHMPHIGRLVRSAFYALIEHTATHWCTLNWQPEWIAASISLEALFIKDEKYSSGQIYGNIYEGNDLCPDYIEDFQPRRDSSCSHHAESEPFAERNHRSVLGYEDDISNLFDDRTKSLSIYTDSYREILKKYRSDSMDNMTFEDQLRICRTAGAILNTISDYYFIHKSFEANNYDLKVNLKALNRELKQINNPPEGSKHTIPPDLDSLWFELDTVKTLRSAVDFHVSRFPGDLIELSRFAFRRWHDKEWLGDCDKPSFAEWSQPSAPHATSHVVNSNKSICRYIYSQDLLHISQKECSINFLDVGAGIGNTTEAILRYCYPAHNKSVTAIELTSQFYDDYSRRVFTYLSGEYMFNNSSSIPPQLDIRFYASDVYEFIRTLHSDGKVLGCSYEDKRFGNWWFEFCNARHISHPEAFCEYMCSIANRSLDSLVLLGDYGYIQKRCKETFDRIFSAFYISRHGSDVPVFDSSDDNSRFDVIIANYVFHHLPKKYRLLMYEWLLDLSSPGAVLAISDPYEGTSDVNRSAINFLDEGVFSSFYSTEQCIKEVQGVKSKGFQWRSMPGPEMTEPGRVPVGFIVIFKKYFS